MDSTRPFTYSIVTMDSTKAVTVTLIIRGTAELLSVNLSLGHINGPIVHWIEQTMGEFGMLSLYPRIYTTFTLIGRLRMIRMAVTVLVNLIYNSPSTNKFYS